MLMGCFACLRVHAGAPGARRPVHDFARFAEEGAGQKRRRHDREGLVLDEEEDSTPVPPTPPTAAVVAAVPAPRDFHHRYTPPVQRSDTGAGTARGPMLPPCTDALGRHVLYTFTNELVQELRLHVAVWAPGRVKLLFLLPHTIATARVTASNTTEELLRYLTPSVIQSLHNDCITWLWGGDGSGAAAPLTAVGTAGVGPTSVMTTSQTKLETYEAFLTDLGGRYRIKMDLPPSAYTRPRPTLFTRAPQAEARGGRQLPPAVHAALVRTLPDAFKFADALDKIRHNLSVYGTGIQQRKRTGKVPGVAAVAGSNPAEIANAMAALARSSMECSITLLFEDQDASYRQAR